MNFKYTILVKIRVSTWNQSPTGCTVDKPWLFHYFTGIHSSSDNSRRYVDAPPWHTVAKPGVTVSYGGFTTVSPGGLTAEGRIMPEELRWFPGISRRCFAPRWVPIVFKNTGDTSWWSLFQHGSSRFNAMFADIATAWSQLAPVSTL